MYNYYDYTDLREVAEAQGARFRHYHNHNGSITTVVAQTTPGGMIRVGFSVWNPDPDDKQDRYIRKEQNYYALLRLKNDAFVIPNNTGWSPTERWSHVHRAVCQPVRRIRLDPPRMEDNPHRPPGLVETLIEAVRTTIRQRKA